MTTMQAARAAKTAGTVDPGVVLAAAGKKSASTKTPAPDDDPRHQAYVHG